MATRIAWLLNLDSDTELRDPKRYRTSLSMAARIGELSSRLSTLLASDDVVLPHACPYDAMALRHPPRADDTAAPSPHANVTVLAFCPTPSARERLGALGLPMQRGPSLEVLRRVTSRGFAHVLAGNLLGAAYVTSAEALHARLATRSFTGTWLLKRDYAFAGRERRLVHGSEMDTPTRGFVRASFERGEGITVEPYVERLSDFAQHGYLTEQGTLLVGPTMTQTCDARGRWERSEPSAEGDLSHRETQALAACVEQAGDLLREASYFGPFGVDAFRYVSSEGTPAFRACCEVNPRFSMGYPRVLLERALCAETSAR